MLRYDAARSELLLVDADGKALADVQLMIRTQGDARAVAWSADSSPDRAIAQMEGLQIEARLSPLPGGLCELRLHIDTEGGYCHSVSARLCPLPGAEGLLDPSTGVVTVGSGFAGRNSGTLADLLDSDDARVQCMVAALHSQAASLGLTVGIGAPAADFTSLQVKADCLQFGFDIDRQLLGAQEYVLTFGVGPEPLGLLEAYGDALARHCRPIAPRPTGYNSWDYYSGAVTMDNLRTEMAAINASPLRGRLRYFCIDMGWENQWGDWRPNRKFPEGYEQVAREIRGAGFEPGIWTAPFQAHVYLPVARRRRDLFATGADGEPVIVQAGTGPCLLFDPTVPQIEQMLLDTYSRMRQAGFTLFKVDYIYRPYIDAIARFHDETLGKAGATRRFLEIIRQAIGPDAHLLSCGAPQEIALGLADSARVSGDIHNFWGHVKAGAAQIAACYWMDGRLWKNDPDFAIIRCSQTSDDPYLNRAYEKRPLSPDGGHWLAGPEADLEELKTWLALVYLSGGAIYLSDSIARLKENGIDLLCRLLEAPTQAARPLDLFTGRPPQYWLAQTDHGGALGIFNWEDDARLVEPPGGIKLPEEGIEVWSGAKVSLTGGVELPAHGALLMRW